MLLGSMDDLTSLDIWWMLLFYLLLGHTWLPYHTNWGDETLVPYHLRCPGGLPGQFFGMLISVLPTSLTMGCVGYRCQG